jgi:hypothetical protein
MDAKRGESATCVGQNKEGLLMRYGRNEYVEMTRTEGESMIRAGEEWDNTNKEEQWEGTRQLQGQVREDKTKKDQEEEERQQETKAKQAEYNQWIEEEATKQIKKEQDEKGREGLEAGQMMTQAASMLGGKGGKTDKRKGNQARQG